MRFLLIYNALSKNIIAYRGNLFMRLKEIKPTSDMRLDIDIIDLDNVAIIVCDGRVKMTKLPAYGETKIVTHQGKVKRVKFDEGEEF